MKLYFQSENTTDEMLVDRTQSGQYSQIKIEGTAECGHIYTLKVNLKKKINQFLVLFLDMFSYYTQIFIFYHFFDFRAIF